MNGRAVNYLTMLVRRLVENKKRLTGTPASKNEGGQRMSQEKAVNRALDLLVPPRRFTREEWCTLIEHRLNCLKPHLDSFTLETMGQTHFIPMAHWVTLEELRQKNVPFDGYTDDLLSSQGIFFTGTRCDWEQWDHQAGVITYPLWGILRNGSLVMITIHFNIITHEYLNNHKGYSAGEIIRVVIEKTDVATIVSKYPDSHMNSETVGPYYLWWQIGRNVKEYAEKRYWLYQKASGLQEQFEIEDGLLGRTGELKPEPKAAPAA
jgi:hypothetical protein